MAIAGFKVGELAVQVLLLGWRRRAVLGSEDPDFARRRVYLVPSDL
jgi:hypothetical protein